MLVRDKICKQYKALLDLELPYCYIFLWYTLHSYSRKTIAFVLDECVLACLEEIYAFPFFSIHFYMFTDASKREGRVKRDLMLCISCPVYIRLPRYPSTKSQLFSKLFSDQTKQKRNIVRLTIDIQNLSIFWVLYPGWFYKVIVEAHNIWSWDYVRKALGNFRDFRLWQNFLLLGSRFWW